MCVCVCVCVCVLVSGVCCMVFVVTPSDQRVPLSSPCAATALRQRVDGVNR